MAQLNHPQYPSLKIIVGEQAQAGAFFVTKPGKALSHIANQAYGAGTLSMVLKINKSLWNRQNCVYRSASNNCSSPQVNPDLAVGQSNWGTGAWIALCQADTPSWAKAMGFNFPPVWIPTVDGKEPGDLVGAPIFGPGPAPTPSPGISLGPGYKPPAQFTPSPGEPQPEPPKTGGFKWYHGLGIALGAAAVVGIAWAASSDKRKKK